MIGDRGERRGRPRARGQRRQRSPSHTTKRIEPIDPRKMPAVARPPPLVAPPERRMSRCARAPRTIAGSPSDSPTPHIAPTTLRTPRASEAAAFVSLGAGLPAQTARPRRRMGLRSAGEASRPAAEGEGTAAASRACSRIALNAARSARDDGVHVDPGQANELRARPRCRRARAPRGVRAPRSGPWSRSTAWSASLKQLAMSCVMTRLVTPKRWRVSSMRSSTARLVSGSRPLVGSS